MKYNYYAKNNGKDLIYLNRLRLSDKLGIDIYNTTPIMYNYLMSATLGILLA